MYKPELEKGSKKYVCPACSNKTFVRYVNNETDNYFADDVGRCDRESKCGYHKPPKQFFIDNPQTSKGFVFVGTSQKKNASNYALPNKNGSQVNYQAANISKKPDYLAKNYLIHSVKNYEQNSFVSFLLDLFSEDSQAAWQAIKDYLIGTTGSGETVFWYVRRDKKICKGKILRYENGNRAAIKTWIDEDGERLEQKADSIESRLKKKNLLKDDFETDKQVFFGEHLLHSDLQKPVAVVESEKTAVIASICLPEFVWVACGSKQSVKPQKLKRLGRRKIVLYPDADGFTLWQKIALEARLQGLDVKVSDLIERRGTNAEKGKGFDLADYLINQQKEINQFNHFADYYNAKLEKVLADEKLFENFSTILDEQKAVLMDRGMSDREAETFITDFDNLRQIVLSV